jgi:hypothetical protein
MASALSQIVYTPMLIPSRERSTAYGRTKVPNPKGVPNTSFRVALRRQIFKMSVYMQVLAMIVINRSSWYRETKLIATLT